MRYSIRNILIKTDTVKEAVEFYAMVMKDQGYSWCAVAGFLMENDFLAWDSDNPQVLTPYKVDTGDVTDALLDIQPWT